MSKRQKKMEMQLKKSECQKGRRKRTHKTKENKKYRDQFKCE